MVAGALQSRLDQRFDSRSSEAQNLRSRDQKTEEFKNSCGASEAGSQEMCAGSSLRFCDHTGMAVAPINTPGVAGQQQTSDCRRSFADQSSENEADSRKPRNTSSMPSTPRKTQSENATRIHAPMDMGDCSLNTRNMFRKRVGRPRIGDE